MHRKPHRSAPDQHGHEGEYIVRRVSGWHRAERQNREKWAQNDVEVAAPSSCEWMTEIGADLLWDAKETAGIVMVPSLA